MVTADYDMKKIADGSDELDVPGLMSVSGMGIKEVEHAIRSRQQPTISVGMNPRLFHLRVSWAGER
jgi:hypothetical protein